MLVGWRKTVSKFILVPQRIIVSIMAFLAISITFMTRTALSFSITLMVYRKEASEAECMIENNSTDISLPEDIIIDNSDRYDWSEQLQGYILASFYIGFLATHVPGGQIAAKYGAKYVLLIGMFVNASFTILTPLCVVYGGVPVLLFARIVVGLSEGVMLPATSTIIAAWIPKRERSRYGTLAFSGSQFGPLFAALFSGYLLGRFDGWTSVYYAFGGLGMAWCFFFFFLCYSDPESHPFLSDKEKDFLEKEMGQLRRKKNQAATPWRLILTSLPVTAICIGQMGFSFTFLTLLSNLPKYMSDVLNFSIRENGLWLSLPYALMFSSAQISGFISDFAINRKYIKITLARKICASISGFLPGIFMMAASYAACDRLLAVALFSCGMGFMGTFFAGVKVNNIDISPNYAGAIVALSNSSGAVMGMIGPFVVGALTPNRLLTEWRIVFWITFALLFASTIYFWIFASGEIQSWNNPEEKKKSVATVEHVKSVEELKLEESMKS